jgi:hypothetical protein
MDFHHTPWNLIILTVIKLLKTFGLIPGALAAYGVRKFYQRFRQKKAMEGWPGTEATIQWGKVHRDGRRFWAEITYSYFVGEYRSGTYVHRFSREEQAEEFVRQLKNKRIHVRYKEADPSNSVILDREIELIALLEPQLR